jgi:hypothetical protein
MLPKNQTPRRPACRSPSATRRNSNVQNLSRPEIRIGGHQAICPPRWYRDAPRGVAVTLRGKLFDKLGLPDHVPKTNGAYGGDGGLIPG